MKEIGGTITAQAASVNLEIPSRHRTLIDGLAHLCRARGAYGAIGPIEFQAGSQYAPHAAIGRLAVDNAIWPRPADLAGKE
jgi:hypothetical protein